jgi:hypothetical protein
VSQLRQQEQELQTLNIDVAVVTFQSSPIAENYVRETKLSWPILIDESLKLYSAYGMHHGRVWDVWGPATIGVYFKLMFKGQMPRKPAGDVNQLGGDILIDPEGIVRLHHIGTGPADRPAIESLLEIVREQSGK